MADKTYIAIAAEYADADQAVADFDQISAHYKATEQKESFDAAVISRGVDGKVSIVKRDDGAKHRGTTKGLSIGLATGLAVALFPPIALGGALLVAGGAGAGIGAVAGHIGRKTPSKDLESIAETLAAGSAGVALVVEQGDVAIVRGLLANATNVTEGELAVDDDELDEEVDEAYE